MTYGYIFGQFYDKFPNADVSDWRPADPMFIPQLSSPIPNAILVWLKDGSKVVFISGEERERMTVEEAIEFGNMWLDMNQDAKDSDTYQFFVMALKALGLTKSGLLKDCESCKAELPEKEDSNESI